MNAITTRIEFPPSWETWNRDRLLTLIKKLKVQNEALIDYQKNLAEHRETEQEKWKLTVRCLEEQIIQLKNDLSLNEKQIHLAALKYSLWAGFINRQTVISNIESELEDEESTDFLKLLNLLPLIPSPTSNSKRLKEETHELRAQISALINEKTFVWEQYRILEENLTSKVRSKEAEIEQTTEDINSLLATKEAFEETINQRDVEITRLKNEMEANEAKWEKEAAKLSRELEELKKATASQRRSALGRCSKENNVKNCKPLSNVKKEFATPSNELQKEHKSGSKRKFGNVGINESGPSKLFSSTFKVPKVKALMTL